MIQIAPNPPQTTLPDWLLKLQAAGRAQHREIGLPTGKEEAWRFTRIAPVLRTKFIPAAPADGTALHAKYSFGEEAGVEIVFVNGQFAPELSKMTDMPDGLSVSTLADAASGPQAATVEQHLGSLVDLARHGFAAWNTAASGDGAFVHVRRSATVESPVHLLFLSVGQAAAAVTHPRVLVVVEEDAQVTFVESYVGDGAAYLSNAVSEFIIGDQARVDHCKLQHESLRAFHTASMQVQIGRQSQFVSHAISLGAAISRNDLTVKLAGQGGYATLNGLVLMSGDQHCDNHTLLDHAAPDCPSHELYKHVLAGKATAVFKGQIHVHQIAQKTNAKQSSKALLLSDTAEMNSMPALEIYADDVKCTHGSTTGPIDEDLVFYLRSRGVGFESARHLLTYAFAADVTRRIRVEPVRRRVEDFMAAQHGLPQDIRINDLGAFDDDVTR